MKIEMGESLFYSWLRHVKNCQIVQTNWKTSSKWTLQNENKLKEIKLKSEGYFNKKYNYQIYKGTKTLSQLLQQAECDIIGISIDNKGNSEIWAIDVAFHESGLNYNGKNTTVQKVINKCIRTAMCIIGYLNKKNGTIIFASPKINNSIMKELAPCIDELQKLMHELGYEFKFELIANGDFQEKIIIPMLKESDEVADTSELFLRSYQMIKMFENTTNKNNLYKN